MSASFQDARITFGKDGRPHSNLPDEAMKTATLFFENSSLSKEHQQALEKALIESANPDVIPQTDLGKALADGSTADVLLGNGLKRVKKVYEEMLLKDVALSKKKWYDLVIGFISKYEFHLPYCKETYHPKMEQLLLELQKEKKGLEKSADLALKKELDISDDELKELKKNLKGSKGRDARGIQTMFRTTSKNHYTLNEMIDRKANIMITVNSIILSLVLGGLIGNAEAQELAKGNCQQLAILVLTIASISSIIFAILSIRPGTTHGEFTEDEIRNKGGNLLYYGNFHNMHLRDYEWAVLQMMNDQDYLYGSMIKDIYYLGQLLAKKCRYIRKSLTIFLVGIVLAVITHFSGLLIAGLS